MKKSRTSSHSFSRSAAPRGLAPGFTLAAVATQMALETTSASRPDAASLGGRLNGAGALRAGLSAHARSGVAASSTQRRQAASTSAALVRPAPSAAQPSSQEA